MSRNDAVPPGMSPNAGFATTRWSLIRTAGDEPTPQARAALETLCRLYWYPLYVFARSREKNPDCAADRVQSFFADFLERGDTARADPTAGRFRSYLLGAFRNHLAKQRERDGAQRRGGDRQVLSLDVTEAERRLAAEAASASPERAFDRAWCLALLERVRARLAERYAADGKGGLYAHLEPFLIGAKPTQSQAELAASLDMTEVAFKVALHRLRRRYATLLRDEVAQTLDDPGTIDAELHELMALLATD